jgi:hypothetical protein
MKSFELIYTSLIGVIIGSIIVVGIIVAPIIFHTEVILEAELLSNFQEGLIQSEIFIRFNYILLTLSLFVLIMETYYFIKKRDFVMYIISLIAVLSSFLFIFYFTNEILNFNNLGESATKSDEFKYIHKASVIDFKVMLTTFVLLIGYKGYKKFKMS